VSPCMSPRTGSGSVAIGTARGSRGAGPSEGGPACGGASELDCAGPHGCPARRGRGAQRGGAGLGCGPSGGGAHRCSRWMESLHVRLRSTFPGRLPRGSVAVWRCAVMSQAPRSAARGASDAGGANIWGRIGDGGGAMRVCDPCRESRRKAHVRHLGAGIRSVPPPGGTLAGPAGAATVWGTGHTTWPTMGSGGRATQGR